MNTRESLRLSAYIEHILEAIRRIDEYVADVDEILFLKNTLIQDAVIRNLEIIGEASKKILEKYPEFLQKNPELPLTFAYGMRNALAHGYNKVDMEIVWKTIEKDLPLLYEELKNIYDDLC